MELFMIYARIGSETFYDTAKRLERERRVQRMNNEQLEQLEQPEQMDDAPTREPQLQTELNLESIPSASYRIQD